MPIRPGSVIIVKSSPNKSWQKNIGRRFRIGYYSRQDGLDCIWLVDDKGKYGQTVDHEFVHQHFEIKDVSKERSLYGKNRPRFGPIA
jgi:hypothetical protein